jgi:hypothetical protein
MRSTAAAAGLLVYVQTAMWCCFLPAKLLRTPCVHYWHRHALRHMRGGLVRSISQGLHAGAARRRMCTAGLLLWHPLAPALLHLMCHDQAVKCGQSSAAAAG